MKNSVFNKLQIKFVASLKYTKCLKWAWILVLILQSFQSLNAQSDSLELFYATNIVVGAEQLDLVLKEVSGKRVAIVGNQTSLVKSVHLVDTLLKLGVDVKKVFSPEHGFRGKADAGEKVENGKDAKTGLPLVSLYGKNKKPSPEMLKDIDLIIFDIQDVGARFYTYISTLHFVMEAAAEQGKEVLVLDRPNPNGHYIDGPILKKEHESFVGKHPIPIVHGMTIAEYAQMINGEGWLKNSIQCKLSFITCLKYDHTKFYKLPVKPSPNLPNMKSIYLYPSLCLFEGTSVSVGRGTDAPFQLFGLPSSPYGGFEFIPVSVPGAKYPKHKGEMCRGFDLRKKDFDLFRRKGELNLEWLMWAYQKTESQSSFFNKNGFFTLLTGDRDVQRMIENGHTASDLKKTWEAGLERFQETRKKYLLYTDF